jgi:hypothetical protein
MNDRSHEEPRSGNGSGFDSRDCRIVVIDAPSDPIDANEPLDPKLLAVLTAERDKIAYWTAVRKEQAEFGDANQS